MQDEHRQDILAEIENERFEQQKKWPVMLDDTHTPADWWTIIGLYYAKSLIRWKIDLHYPHTYDRAVLRAGLVKIGAIVLAWIEAIDRANNPPAKEVDDSEFAEMSPPEILDA